VGDIQPDRAARFRRVYADNYRSLVAYARRRTSNADDAADVVAETFLVTWQRLDDIEGSDRPLPWLYGVARNVILNQQRGDRRRERLAERLRFELAPISTDPPEAEATSAAHEALAFLSESDREVLRLSAWEGLSPAEMAAVLNCSPGTARVRLLRARRRFAHHFAERAEGEGNSFPRRHGPALAMRNEGVQ